MVQFTNALLFALATATVRAAPLTLTKRIAQTTIDSVTPWETACTAAGGGSQCNPIAVTAAATLLAAAGPCDQQNSGDAMVNLAKTLNNNADMISLAQLFVQQPRNSPTSQAVPYCEQAPQNSELNGFFQCQFQGSNQNTFVGGVKVGGAGTIPFGQNAPLNPAGSCPASPSGPVPDGQQLNAITKNPGTPSSGSSSASSSNNASGSGSSSAAGSSSSATSNNSGSGAAVAGSGSAAASATDAASSAAATSASTSSSSSSSSGFALSNGQEAQKLNAQFATLSASSSCQAGQNACVNGAFAQCVSGAFVTTACAGGTTCAALPLVNSPGTSITCTTTADAEARIAATGATGGLTGSGASAASGSASASTPANAASGASASAAAPATNNAAASTSSSSAKSFTLSNGQEAQKLNAQFATLTASSSCTAGQNACVNGGFAQCVNGSFEVTQCGSGLTCAALPLVNSAGTSITCTTTADAQTRIAATGATGGLTGSN
ncbi:hypothetical protein GYMLUDRAFT_42332 [Collybiopsis luxurians FD-317 M1]|uniref:Carbohydrate-binding module family 19 domain-containing protein n=1 Tax=Collybiopsis luxurians FD-317 M1 TaxID=944289 RepID=A0A0D0CZE7_9AGAR|nr:hypothetical protein GYMLUDRAFT_42332 [Collybiopsis luxurians FD-317 M1]